MSGSSRNLIVKVPTRPILAPLAFLQLAVAPSTSFADSPLFWSAPPNASPFAPLLRVQLLLRTKTALAISSTLSRSASNKSPVSRSSCRKPAIFAAAPLRPHAHRTPLYHQIKSALSQHLATAHGANCPTRLRTMSVLALCPNLMTRSGFAENKFCRACQPLGFSTISASTCIQVPHFSIGNRHGAGLSDAFTQREGPLPAL